LRVLLDTSFAARGRSGTGVYVDELRRELARLEGVELVEARQRLRVRAGRAGGAAERRSHVRSALNAGLDLWWELVALPRTARAVRADVLHHPLPAHAPRAGCAQVITVHDMAYARFPESFDPVWRRIAGRAHRRAARLADAVVCPSEAAAAEAVELLGVPRELVVVAHHGPGQGLPSVAGSGADAATAGHLLYIGSDEPRKDVDSLLQAYAAYRAARPAGEALGLVLAGEAARRAPAAPDGVRGEPAPGRERLAELLHGAVALVHPSPYEGFGLAPLEAMAAGVPVVTVPSTAASEVYGDAVLTAGPSDGLAVALDRIHADAELRERLAAAGREHAARFSWRASAERHVEAYCMAIGTA
jgi:glycosyltransferase involved in cell wall biosynthesis